MQDCVRRAAPLAIALVFVISGVASAGDNAGATFTLLSANEFSDVGADGTVAVQIAASGLVGMKQFQITMAVSPAGAFDLSKASFAPEGGLFGLPEPGEDSINFGFASFGAALNDDFTFGVATMVLSSSFTTETEATITVTSISIGPDADNRDVFGADILGMTITINPAPPPAPVASFTADPVTGEAPLGVSFTDESSGEITSRQWNFGDEVTSAEASPEHTYTSAGTYTATLTVSGSGGTATHTLEIVVTAPPVTEPTLTATSASDASKEFSAIGDGDAADGSAGEVAYSVAFTDASGSAAAGQSITWTISNSGAESVFVLGGDEIAAGTEATVTTDTDADGAASITLDAEGGQASGSTSASVTAATTADNSDGESRSLSQAFSATWDVAVPAELASFASQIGVERDVLLEWAVPSQSNNLGWEVYRSVDKVAYELVSQLIVGDGTTDQVRTYQFVDANPPLVDVVFYYLKQIDLDGSSSRSTVLEVLFSPTAVQGLVVPTANALRQNYPNPFNPETTISFELANEAQVSLTIYDLTGQQLRTLVSGEALAAGAYQRQWDGRNSAGSQVASGVYFFVLKAGTYTSNRKMILLQ
jgi:PKD repeat protein